MFGGRAQEGAGEAGLRQAWVWRPGSRSPVPHACSACSSSGRSAWARSPHSAQPLRGPTTRRDSYRGTVKPKLACMRGKVIIGLCGSPDGLLPACGSSYKTSCEASGGTAQSCGPNGSACASITTCSDGSELFHDCDEKFMLTCEDKDVGGDFQCAGRCDDGTCCAGECTIGG